MAERMCPRVIVPDVVGLPFHIGRDVSSDAGVALDSVIVEIVEYATGEPHEDRP